jgi:transposase-like protein
MQYIEGMDTHIFHCPHGRQAEPVVRFGTNRSGTRRLWCKACRKAFTPQPRDRSVTPEKEESIAAALTERLSQRGPTAL